MRPSPCCESARGSPFAPRLTNRRLNRSCSSSSSWSLRIASATTTRAFPGCGSLTMISMRSSRRPRTTFVPFSPRVRLSLTLASTAGSLSHPPLLPHRTVGPCEHLYPPLLRRLERPREPRVRLPRHARHSHRIQSRRPLCAIQARSGRVLPRGQAEHGQQHLADPVLDVRRARCARLERVHRRHSEPGLLYVLAAGSGGGVCRLAAQHGAFFLAAIACEWC